MIAANNGSRLLSSLCRLGVMLCWGDAAVVRLFYNRHFSKLLSFLLTPIWMPLTTNNELACTVVRIW
jgi:hypothetical protein